MISVMAYFNAKREKVNELRKTVLVEIADYDKGEGGQYRVSDFTHLKDDLDGGYDVESFKTLGYKKQSTCH